MDRDSIETLQEYRVDEEIWKTPQNGGFSREYARVFFIPPLNLRRGLFRESARVALVETLK